MKQKKAVTKVAKATPTNTVVVNSNLPAKEAKEYAKTKVEKDIKRIEKEIKTIESMKERKIVLNNMKASFGGIICNGDLKKYVGDCLDNDLKAIEKKEALSEELAKQKQELNLIKNQLN